MVRATSPSVRTLAVLAHVDHGKTTLVDRMLWEAELEARGELPDTVGPDDTFERDKLVALLPRVTGIVYRGFRLQLLDLPVQADLGALERTLRAARGLLFVVDAAEGPAPQVRIALGRALEAGLVPVLVLNKMDRPDARPAQVLEEVRALFRDLEASEAQQRFPVYYTNAWAGTCRTDLRGPERSLRPLLEGLIAQVPPNAAGEDQPVQVRVFDLDYDDFYGRLAVGQVVRGRLERGQSLVRCCLDGRVVPGTWSALYVYEGLEWRPAAHAGPETIVVLGGVGQVSIGETLAAAERPEALPALPLDPPTLAVDVAPNDSPMAGQDGRFASAEKLRERLYREALGNVTLEVEAGERPDSFRIRGRNELQLAMFLEGLRREGYEMTVSGPEVLLREGGREEPVERLLVDCPEAAAAVVREKAAEREARLVRMINHGSGWVRMIFQIPTRGLIGFRSELLHDTKGLGIMAHRFETYSPWNGQKRRRATGALVSDRSGRATAYALAHLQQRGSLFLGPDDEVYEGMIVGEHSAPRDMRVNVCKVGPDAWSRADAGAVGERPRAPLVPPRSLSLEQALEFVRDDECVEVTPRALRLRKRQLGSAAR